MSQELRKRLFAQLDSLTIVDPHTHINALAPAAATLSDILGYHYYTELAHSAGMAKNQIEEPDLDPREKVERLITHLGPIENTIQYSWLVEMCQKFFGLTDDRITADNWGKLYEAAAAKMAQPDWADQVLKASKISAVFLTNEFDDPLEGFDTNTYIPCLRTDDLVFHLAKPEVRERLERATGVTLSNAESVRDALGSLFDHFTARGARACAISLPPDFTPAKVSDGRVNSALDAVATVGANCGDPHRRAIANFVFWTLAEYCADYSLPFDLMIGVNRGVYEGGVHQGRDLYDSRVSLVQYRELFNAFPLVTFPVSVLASVTNQELASYAWIFPNVVTNGHWWYSNTPAFIEHDLAARLEAVPRTKQIGYYSDMYKLEFALPKFAMYKRILAKVLAERFVIDRGWSEERAFELGQQVLAGNTDRIFPSAENRPAPVVRQAPPAVQSPSPFTYPEPLPMMAAAATMAPLAGATEDPSSVLEPFGSHVITPAADMGEELDLAPPMTMNPMPTNPMPTEPMPSDALEELDEFAEFEAEEAELSPATVVEGDLPPELEIVDAGQLDVEDEFEDEIEDEVQIAPPEEIDPEIAPAAAEGRILRHSDAEPETPPEPKPDSNGWDFLLDDKKKK